MGYEASKAIKRRYNDGAFHSRYFVGNGIDVGCGPDSIARFCRNTFPLMISIKNWEFEPDGDAQYFEGVENDTFNFLHSSHSLEHMENVRTALIHWIRIIKPGGYLIITVPDEDMYEQGVFPSRFNTDHKHTFTMHKNQSWSRSSINILDLAAEFSDSVQTERLIRHTDFYINTDRVIDQTTLPNTTECSIEWILKKN
jgi:SAM-dependent methyltransferase